MAKEMTERENMLAILNGEQPEWYGDIFKTMVFAPDPIFASDSKGTALFDKKGELKACGARVFN